MFEFDQHDYCALSISPALYAAPKKWSIVLDRERNPVLIQVVVAEKAPPDELCVLWRTSAGGGPKRKLHSVRILWRRSHSLHRNNPFW